MDRRGFLKTTGLVGAGAGAYGAYERGYVSFRMSATVGDSPEPTHGSTPTPSSPTPDPDASTEIPSPQNNTLKQPFDPYEFSKTVSNLTASIRLDHDLPIVSHSRELYEELGQPYAEAMAEAGVLTHSLNGRTFEDRSADLECTYAGENIATTFWKTDVETGDGVEYYDTPKELAEAVLEQWMNSDPHRENILEERFNVTACGIGVTSDNEVFAAQEFCN